MRIHGSLSNELSPEMAAMLRPRRSPECCERGPQAADARKRALHEVGKALGLDFKGITQAVRALLVKAAANGKDGVPAVLDAVNKALAKAGESLKASGFSDAQVETALNDVRDQLGSSLAANAEQTMAQSTVYARTDKASLSIETQEGDEVRVRFASRTGLVAQDGGADSGAERRVYGFASGRIEVSVEGELNDEELAAIGALVAKVDALARDFFAGDIQKAFTAAAHLGFDGEQIASFALKLSSRELLQQSGPVGALPEPPQPQPAPAITNTPAPATAAAPSAATTQVPALANSEPVIDPAVKPAAETPVTPAPPAAVAGPLSDFLKRVFEFLGQPAQAGGFEFSITWKVQLVINAVQAADPAPKPAPGTALLTNSIAAIGDQLTPAGESLTRPAGAN